MLEKEEQEKRSTKPELKAKLYEMRKEKRETLRSSALRATDAKFISNRKYDMVCFKFILFLSVCNI